MARKLTKVYGWYEELSIVACAIHCVEVDVPASDYSKADSGELYFSGQTPEGLGEEGNWFATFADAKREALRILKQQFDDAKSCLSIIRNTRLVDGKIIRK